MTFYKIFKMQKKKYKIIFYTYLNFTLTIIEDSDSVYYYLYSMILSWLNIYCMCGNQLLLVVEKRFYICTYKSILTTVVAHKRMFHNVYFIWLKICTFCYGLCLRSNSLHLRFMISILNNQHFMFLKFKNILIKFIGI